MKTITIPSFFALPLLLLLIVMVKHVNAIVTSSSPSSSDQTTSLCENPACSCPQDTWGSIMCQCTTTQQELIIRAHGRHSLPSHLTTLLVAGCERVVVMEDAFLDLRYIQKVQLRDIRRLEVSARAFSRPLESDGVVPDSIPEVLIEGSYIPELSSYAFRGYIRAIRLRDVKVDSIAPFAFASLTAVERIDFRDCQLDSVNAQAFKKFAVERFSLVGTNVTSALPSRAATDLEVLTELRLERVFAVRLHSSSLLVRGPKSVHVSACKLDHLEGEALRIASRGPVYVQDNIFPSVDPGAFVGFSVERHTLREKGRQELVFTNNTLHSFKAGALNFNETSFEPRVERTVVSRQCVCDDLELWLSQLKTSVDQLWCTDTLSDELVVATDSGCSSLHAWNGTLVLVATICGGLLVLGIALLALCCWRRRQRTRGKRWVNVPTANKNNKKMGIVLPDGRTYRETELHVIVERAEPIDDKE